MARVYAAAAGASVRKMGVAPQRDIMAALSLVNWTANDGDDPSDDSCCSVARPTQTEYLGWHSNSRHFQRNGFYRNGNGTRKITLNGIIHLLRKLGPDYVDLLWDPKGQPRQDHVRGDIGGVEEG